MHGLLDELERDTALLEAAERQDEPGARAWTVREAYVVVGLGQDVETEVHEAACAARGIPVVRRSTGGGAVMVGPGTVQWAIALPYGLHPDLRDIGKAKALCNELVIRALGRGLTERSGDLVWNDRKVGGLALRRKRSAVLVHGTLLADADLALLEQCLKHPSKEPTHRRGRPHGEFLRNLGPIDHRTLERTLRRTLAELVGQGFVTAPTRV